MIKINYTDSFFRCSIIIEMVGSEFVQQSCRVETRIIPLQVSAVLLTRIDPRTGQLQICVVDRTDREGVITLPGGKVETGLGELPEEAALRELFEETGIMPHHGVTLGCFQLQKTFYTRIGERIRFHLFSIPLFKCYPVFPEKRVKNHGPWMFLTIDEIMDSYRDRCILPAILREVFMVPSRICESCLMIQLGYEDRLINK